MSSIRRFIDLARSNLNSLLERAAETADPRRRLASIPDAELEAELARRRSARATEQKFADAKARIEEGPSRAAASSGPMPDRAARERAAREREDRVRATRAAREADRARAAEQARADQARRAASSGQRSSTRPPPSSGAATPRGRDPVLVRYYERLEIEYGSDYETVKAAYRKLMRKYHPDLHGQKSPEKLRAATEVSQALTQAYNELEKVLVGGPNKGR
jgi:DnaJ-domain-containing protein 1